MSKKGTQRGTSKRLKKLRDRTIRHKTNDATLSNLNEYVTNLIAEISTAQEDHEVASQTVQKSIAKLEPTTERKISWMMMRKPSYRRKSNAATFGLVLLSQPTTLQILNIFQYYLKYYRPDNSSRCMSSCGCCWWHNM